MVENDMTQTSPAPTEETESGWETLKTILYALIIALTVRTFAYEPFNIPSGSMVPSLLVGDFLFVSKFAYGYGTRGTFFGLLPFSGRWGGSPPQRGDVIVFKLPNDPSVDYIKRLIGLPGDKIQMRQGLLYINGLPVERTRQETLAETEATNPPPQTADYIEHLPQGPEHLIREYGDDRPLDQTDVFTVPPGHYFFMGDNRDNSQDSRTTHVGMVPEENLVGRAERIFFSIDEKSHAWQFWAWPWTVRWSRLLDRID